jgi:hypothetical protein
LRSALSGKAHRPDYHGKDTQLRNNSDFGFHSFIWLSVPGNPGFNYQSKVRR